jgi:hypothetical protein
VGKAHKPSTTSQVLNGVFGSGNWGHLGPCQKVALME